MDRIAIAQGANADGFSAGWWRFGEPFIGRRKFDRLRTWARLRRNAGCAQQQYTERGESDGFADVLGGHTGRLSVGQDDDLAPARAQRVRDRILDVR